MHSEQPEINKREKSTIMTPESDGTMKPLGASILDFFSVITKYRRFLVWFILLATFITAVVAFFSPKWYKATASVFPAEQASMFPELEGISSIVKSFSGSKKLGGLTGPVETDRYIAILKSSRVLSAVIDKFDLTHVYNTATSSYVVERTTKELVENTDLIVQDEGNLTISVYDKDPKRAAEMANYYVELLNQTNSELLVQNAKGNREFIEQRYQKNLEDLHKSEEAMKSFQTKYGVIAVPEQMDATIKAGAELYGKLAAKEVELDVLKRTTSETHPSVVAADVEVQEMKKKLREMNAGSITAGDDMKVLVPFKQAPELAAQYIRLYRDLQIQNKTLEFIVPIYEQAKIEEQRNTPSVVVLDHAGVPERKAKPKVSLYTLIAFVVSTLLSLLVVFSVEGVSRVRSINPERFDGLVKAIRADRFGLFWKRHTNNT